MGHSTLTPASLTRPRSIYSYCRRRLVASHQLRLVLPLGGTRQCTAISLEVGLLQLLLHVSM